MLCGCIKEKTISNCLKQIKKAQQNGADLIELRIDYLTEKNDLARIIADSFLPVIATNRAGEQQMLTGAINAGAKYIDMDINEVDRDVLKYAEQKKCKVILSYHNYKDTPPLDMLLDIAGVLKRSANVAKIITTAKSQKDNEIILSLYRKVDYPLIAFAMGAIGQSTRIDCRAYGALWTYCNVGGKEIAPGQLSLKKVKEKKIFCVIGNPTSHSMSPAMHNANFNSLDVSARYVSVEVHNLKRYAESIVARDISGVNVTIPYKVDIIKYLDKVDPLARKIGAVNTIDNKNGKLIGYNTDASGALQALREKIKDIKNKNIIVLGSGGAARAIYFALKKEKANVLLLAIDNSEAKKIGKALSLNKENLRTQLANADVLINCTPVGMGADESLVPKEYLKKKLVVFDIVYTPIKTRLIRDAESAGCKTVLGYKMLAYQGAQSFEVWTGLKANISVMLAAVKNRLLPNITLIGFMGTGKTHVGKILAKNLKYQFVDLDEEIEKKEKMTISDIFERHGEMHFRESERKMLREISERKNLIISCGGGVVLSEQNRNMLKSFITILLEARPETIVKRLEENHSRPLLKGLSNQEKINKIKEMMAKRSSFYNVSADYLISTDKRSPREVAGQIEKIIKSI